MRAPQTPCVLCLILICVLTVSGHTISQDTTVHDVASERKFELFEGVQLTFPSNETDSLMSIRFSDTGTAEEGRKKRKKMMEKLMPLFIMPFLIQSTIVPLFLSILKFMLVKSLMVGKLALVLLILNAFKNHNSFKGRHDADIANIHYGYHGNGMEEYGAYIN